MKRILTLICIALAMSFSAFAQGGYEVKGTIVDASGPVIGATVLEQGTSNGTSTDLDGNFSLTVKSESSIVEISCIGYKTQTFQASQVPARITLAEDTEMLDDVVVIGYGTVKKSDLTGSVTTVKADEINKGVISTPADMLRGKTAGVVVTSGSGQPGAGATIRIRGGSSLQANNDPLIVIDGLPISDEGIDGMSDPLSSINPDDIESFSVLMDASATAIYGSRASNGVIVITTKKGSGSSIPNVDFSFSTSLSHVDKYVDVLNASEIRELIASRYGTDSDAYNALGSSDTNWQKEIYQLAPTYEGNLSVKGKVGMGKNFSLPYRVSGGYLSQEGVLKTSKMNRGTLSVNLSPSFFDNHLTVNLNGKGVYTKNWFANQDAIAASIQMDPTRPVYDDSSEGNHGYSIWRDLSGNVNTMATQNPVALLEEKDDQSTVKRFIGNAQFDYRIHGFEDLRLNLNLGLDFAKSDGWTESPEGSEQSYHSTVQSGSGYHTDYDYMRRDQTLEVYADYNHDFGKHHVDLMGGYSWQHFWHKANNYSYKLTDNSVLSDTPERSEYYLISFYGRLNYSFDSRYLLTATLRRDGTSRFQNHKWGLFPSVAFAWNMKNESFLRDFSDISTSKLRLSWGQTGQQDLNAGDYPSFATYYNNQLGSYYYFGDQLMYPITALGYNADLKWETTTTYNVGYDFGAWDDRFTASLDVYYRKTSDLLNYIPVAAMSNLTNYLNCNIGDLENKGVELNLNGIIISRPDMSFTVGANVAYNHNEITKLTASANDKTGVEVGGITGGTGNTVQMHQVGYPAYAYHLYQQVYDEDGNPIFGEYVDRNGDGTIDSDDKYFCHKPSPDVTVGLNMQFIWKRWTAALSGHGSFGNWNYYNVGSNNTALADLWTNSFVSNRLSSCTDANFETAEYLTDYFLQNASFFKFDNFTIGYTFPKIFSVAQRDVALNIYGTVQNIYTITGYDGLDPEVFQGIDYNLYPRPRTYTLGIKLNF
jgi:TonB-linked SusC/RagA family outer membrane protein